MRFLTNSFRLCVVQTTCFNDTVLIPIPNFLLVLVGLPVVLAAGTTTAKSWRHRWFDWLLDVLVVAALCMNILGRSSVLLDSTRRYRADPS